jgi:FKBP-type peptidyl-prolyl cis-trans isomerase SlpA
MTVTENSNVKVHYTGKFEDETVFDTSLTEGREPLSVELGKGLLIPGFEKALYGLKVGEKKTINIPSDEAYGPIRTEMVQEVEKQLVPEGIEVGQVLTAEGPQGPMAVTVVEIKETTVVLDANHPLAGKDLIFDLELLEIA